MSEENQKYPLRISITWYVVIFLLVAASAGVTYYEYGSTSCMPEPVAANISLEYFERPVELTGSVPYAHRMLRDGERVVAKADNGRDMMWIETEDGQRGLVPLGAIKNWHTITGRPDFEKYEINEAYYTNISKKQMEEEYIGHTFAENEMNHWPALSCIRSHDTIYATYQLRMWDGLNPLIPTVCYVDNKAVKIVSFKKAPFNGNMKWLSATPWAEWLYTTRFFHIHWDKPMIPRPKIEFKNWWWIFRFPMKIIMLIIVLVIKLYWRIIICNPLVIFILLLFPFRFLFRKWSNSKVTWFLMGVMLCSAFFYMPLFLMDYGSFFTIAILLSVIAVGGGMVVHAVRQRCEQCLNVGFIEVFDKTLNHTEYEKEKREEQGEEIGRTTNRTKEIEQLLDANDRVLDEREVRQSKSVYITYRYYEYEVTIEKKYYDHHCSCTICNNYIYRKNEEMESKEIDKKLIRTYKKTKYSLLESL